MFGIIVIAFGLLIIMGSLIMYSFLVEYARGMNVTGCQQYCSIRWDDFTGSDSLIFYIPALFGLIITIFGVFIYRRHMKK